MARSLVPLLPLLCMVFFQSAVALHLCVDRLFNDTQGRHNDGLPHLNPTEEETWMNLLPRKLGPMAEFNWLALYRSLTRGDNTGGHQVTAEFLSQVSLHDVRLNPGSMYWQGQQTNLEYLLYLDPDRLVWSFRQQAGIPTIGEHYGGWEAPDSQLRGHFVGHYLSASAHVGKHTQLHAQGEDDEGGGHPLPMPKEHGQRVPLSLSREDVRHVRRAFRGLVTLLHHPQDYARPSGSVYIGWESERS